MRVQALGALLLQGARLLPKLWRAPDDGARRAPRRRGPAAGAGAPVGAHGAVSAALPDGVEPRREPRGARGVRARAARRVRARGPRARPPRWADGHGHGDSALGRWPQPEETLMMPAFLKSA